MRRHRRYTPEEIQFVKKNIRGRPYIETLKLFNKEFGLRLTLKQFETLAGKRGLRNGIGSYNGGGPPNKGRKKKKNWWKTSRGNHSPVGTERETRYGRTYIVVKTAEPSVWKSKHTAIWEKANGKVPKGHAVIFADGNNRNFDLGNLLLVSRKELAVMNSCGLIYSHKDLTAAGKTIADLKMAINKRKRKN